ncbi:MAG: FAD binding domain-containing protein [Gammaproteobacteria bacterium]|jgi:CO/xanthine dehydrogenase FAD-binding subunit
MKPAPFDYYRAKNIEHACKLLAAHGEDAKILAGGQSLIAAMNYRLARPSVLIDISNIENSNEIREEDDGIRIAATTTQAFAEKHPSLRRRLPVLAGAIENIAHFQIRNKGTVGGSIVNADPASELPAMSLLLDAELEIRSTSQTRTIPAEELFITYMTTSLEPDEVLASILFKAPPADSGWGLHEVARRAGDYALVGSAAILSLDEQRNCKYARVVLFGVAATPVRAREVEEALVGSVCSEELIASAAASVAAVIEAESDVHVTEAYRARTAQVLTARALKDAWNMATGAA